MKLGPHARHQHPGFTLVELLIVITIIAILVALLTAGIFGFIGEGNVVRNQSEINQLSIAVQNFKNKYGVYPPERIALGTNSGAMDLLVPGSSAMVTRIWPRIQLPFVDWTGQGNPAGNPGPIILEGDQCLVFFLRGIHYEPAIPPAIPAKPLVDGFATNPQNPTIGAEGSPPLFDFDNGRLFPLRHLIFRSYMDVYGNPVNPLDPADPSRPFLYFSSGNRHNGYNGGYNILGVTPYRHPTNATKFMNPDTFQIISAGANKAFGTGILWTPGILPWNPQGPGYDDMANFTSNKLGIGP